MAGEYTPAVLWALQAAQQLAQEQAAAAVEPLHLLQALLREREGRPWQLVYRAGVEVAALEAWLPAGGNLPAPATSSLPLSPALEEVLVAARRLAREVSPDGSIASELVLLSLLRQDAACRQALERLHLDFLRLEQAVLDLQAPPLRLEEPLELADGPETFQAARILDAAGNRAREALRVLEDYCRFALDDLFWTGELKELRHQLQQLLADLPGEQLLAARDTLGDVGTTQSTPTERTRHSLSEVVQAACKRLQEALRSLEEVSKLYRPEVAERLEQLRYRSYTLESSLLLGREARQRLAGACLYVLLTAEHCRLGLEQTIRAAAAGGAQIFQLREKHLDDRRLLERARQVRRWTRAAGALFLVNDRVDIARLAEADGVHLGQDDLSVRDARRLLGPCALIGVSTHNLEQLHQALREGASYVGLGPVFPSATKAFAEFPGLDFLRQAATTTTLPAFAIGGITLSNVREVVAAGIRRVAVSQAICQAEDPQAVAAAFRQALETS
jgi:thiamine-phosphate pyrophosphorylase